MAEETSRSRVSNTQKSGYFMYCVCLCVCVCMCACACVPLSIMHMKVLACATETPWCLCVCMHACIYVCTWPASRFPQNTVTIFLFTPSSCIHTLTSFSIRILERECVYIHIHIKHVHIVADDDMASYRHQWWPKKTLTSTCSRASLHKHSHKLRPRSASAYKQASH